jgi:hypothetical protein
VHVALARLRGERVQLLLHPEHVQRGDTQDLGLAALEQRRAVHPRQHLDLRLERADVGQAAAVDADLVGQHALADQLLGERAEGCGQLLLTTLEVGGQLLDHGGLDGVGGRLAVVLARDGEGLRQLLGGSGLDGGERVVLVVREERELAGRLRGPAGQVGPFEPSASDT